MAEGCAGVGFPGSEVENSNLEIVVMVFYSVFLVFGNNYGAELSHFGPLFFLCIFNAYLIFDKGSKKNDFYPRI